MNLRCLESLLLLPSPWLRFSLEFLHQFHPAIFLYHLHHGYKLLRMTWSIVKRKLMNLRHLESQLLSPLPWLRLFYHLFYQFYHLFISFIIHKFLRMTWYIVNREADEFGRLVSLFTLPSLTFATCPGICSYAWFVCFSFCICNVPGSVLLFVSGSTMSVLILDLLTPPLLWLWLWLGRLLLCLCLLCAWVRSSVCVCVYCICACTWFIGSSFALSVPIPGSSAPLSGYILCLGLFFHLRWCLLCLCLCLVYLLLCRFVCSCAWVVHSSIYICYVSKPVPPSTSAFVDCLCLYLVCRLLSLCLLYL